MKSRKPHLLKVKQEIVGLIDKEIRNIQRLMGAFGMDNEANQRTLAIWVKERNILAKKADMEEIPLTKKDGQGKLIYVAE